MKMKDKRWKQKRQQKRTRRHEAKRRDKRKFGDSGKRSLKQERVSRSKGKSNLLETLRGMRKKGKLFEVTTRRAS